VARRSPNAWRRIAGQLVQSRIDVAAAMKARDDDAAQSAVRRYMQRAKDLVGKYGSAT
jgi:DNA-binding FadR family transcriptional regulator